MLVNIEVPDSKIETTLCSAFEGIGYWASFQSAVRVPVGTIFPWQVPMRGGVILLTNVYDPGRMPLPLNRSNIYHGLVAMAKKHPQHFADLLSESNQDKVTGDVLVQLAVFGELVYG